MLRTFLVATVGPLVVILLISWAFEVEKGVIVSASQAECWVDTSGASRCARLTLPLSGTGNNSLFGVESDGTYPRAYILTDNHEISLDAAGTSCHISATRASIGTFLTNLIRCLVLTRWTGDHATASWKMEVGKTSHALVITRPEASIAKGWAIERTSASCCGYSCVGDWICSCGCHWSMDAIGLAYSLNFW